MKEPETKILLFQDYPHVLVPMRAAFNQAKQFSRKMDLTYFIKYVAVLRIKNGEKVVSFSSPQEPEKYLKNL